MSTWSIESQSGEERPGPVVGALGGGRSWGETVILGNRVDSFVTPCPQYVFVRSGVRVFVRGY